MEKTIIVAIITNLGTLIVLFWLLARIQRLMREHPPHDHDDEDKVDDGWHSWRFWVSPDDDKTGQADKSTEGGDEFRTDPGPTMTEDVSRTSRSTAEKDLRRNKPSGDERVRFQ